VIGEGEVAGEEEVEFESAPGDSAFRISLGSRAKAMAARCCDVWQRDRCSVVYCFVSTNRRSLRRDQQQLKIRRFRVDLKRRTGSDGLINVSVRGV